MIALSLTLAVTPVELADELPAARAQLTACETSCAHADGARAAFLLAVGTYVQEGVADGALAATVRALDPEMFATLPDVVRDAASEPLPWAVRTAPAARPPAETPVPTLRATPDPRGEGAMLTITVTDPFGAPIPGAIVRFDDEQENHRVNATTGAWSATALILPDGQERAFHKGDVLQLQVTADGHAPVRVAYVTRKRKNDLTIVLQPSP